MFLTLWMWIPKMLLRSYFTSSFTIFGYSRTIAENIHSKKYKKKYLHSRKFTYFQWRVSVFRHFLNWKKYLKKRQKKSFCNLDSKKKQEKCNFEQYKNL